MPLPDASPAPRRTKRKSRAVFKLAREAEKLGNWEQSVTLLKEALILGEKEDESERTTKIEDYLAVCLLNVGLAAKQENRLPDANQCFREAEGHSRKIVVAREKVQAVGKEVERARNGLAQSLRAQYDIDASQENYEKLLEAIKLLEENLDLQISRLPADDDALLTTQNDLALSLARAGWYTQA